MAPRLVRRRPFSERLRAFLNPLDVMLWIAEEVDSKDWNDWEKECANPIGLLFNFVFLVARANSGTGVRGRGDDIFSEDPGYTGWLSWFASFVVHLLSLLSVINATYTFYRRRHYRLFEGSIDNIPSTQSAQRVRVDSSPLSSSPLRFLSNILAGESAESRAHPDAARDVWEIAAWDPTPISLRMFCLFSPGHALVYWLFLPTTIADPRPSTTVVTTIVLAALLSAQLLLLQNSFSQQSKDASVIHKEVMNEYDTKFVHPRTQPLMRDVGTQFSDAGMSRHGLPEYPDENDSVDTYPPAFIINRGFQTRPNPNYVKHFDPEGSIARSRISRTSSTNFAQPFQTPAHLRDASSPIRPQTAIRQPQFRSSGTGGGGGGSLGVFSHANSPLRKAASTNFAGSQDLRDKKTSYQKRDSSPLKRESFAPAPDRQRWS